MVQVLNPNGTKQSAHYDSLNRPGIASKAQRQTERVYDAIGRWTWSRTNALGQLVEIVQPPIPGDSAGADTTYSYDVVGNLTKIIWGLDKQESDFRYNSVGRLTAEFLPEKNRTLNASGDYVGGAGQWSDVFTYDNRSNLAAHTDARGVKAYYDYQVGTSNLRQTDPLNRLQQIYFDTSKQSDTTSPILASPRGLYSYVGNGDLTRLAQVSAMVGCTVVSSTQYTYDPEERLSSKTDSIPGAPNFVLSYAYDALNRLVEKTYPAEFGIARQPQKKLSYNYDVGGALSELKIDGEDYLSQIQFDASGQATSMTVGPTGAQQTRETYTYDPATDLLSAQQVQHGNSALLNLRYTYFGNGQLRQLIEAPGVANYDYDPLGRLTGVQASIGSVWSEAYAYDHMEQDQRYRLWYGPRRHPHAAGWAGRNTHSAKWVISTNL